MKTLRVLITLAGIVLPAFGTTSPIPSGMASSPDYIGGFSYPGQNLICFSSGCGGAFQATVYGPGATTPTGSSILTSVWCVDYQLDVTSASNYIADIKPLNSIGAPTDSQVRYGNLNSDTADTPAAPGWANALTGANALAGTSAGSASPNSAAYRYTLAAALVSQYQNGGVADPANLDGGSAVNRAIQEAIWYVTYNNDYAPGATWPPSDVNLGAADLTSNTNYAFWIKYAEQNAASVQLSDWGVISGPADAAGTLLNPQTADGYPSYQTLLVQIQGGGVDHQSPLPEPGYEALSAVALGGMFMVARFRRRRTASTEPLA